MAKLTLQDLSNLQNEQTAVSAINNNNQSIEIALDNTLSRNGASPNQMESDLDMNSNRIYNLPQGVLDHEPVIMEQFTAAVLGDFEDTGIFVQESEFADLLEEHLPDTGLIREVLQANRTYYVSTTGNDSNDGLSSGTAFATIRKAFDTVATLDLNNKGVTIQVEDGTYDESPRITSEPVGNGSIILRGNPSNPQNVIINPNVAQGHAIAFATWGREFQINGFTLKTNNSTGSGLLAHAGCRVLASNLRFDTCVNAHVFAQENAQIILLTNYSVVGGAAYHWLASTGGLIFANSVTITLSGTPAFSQSFARAERGGGLLVTNNTYTGSATGVRYTADSLGWIAPGSSTLPGNASGFELNGGRYIAASSSLSGPARDKLVGTRTYYVDPSLGSDTNDGLTSGAGAFQTLAKAISVVSLLDTAGFNVTIQLANATYTNVSITSGPVGGGVVIIRGDPATPSNVVITSSTTNALYIECPTASYRLNGMSIGTTGSGTHGLNVINTYVEIQNIVFTAAVNTKIYAQRGSRVISIGNITSSGNANSLAYATSNSLIGLDNITITHSGAVTYSQSTLVADRSAGIGIVSTTWSGTTPTGKKYDVRAPGWITPLDNNIPAASEGVYAEIGRADGGAIVGVVSLSASTTTNIMGQESRETYITGTGVNISSLGSAGIPGTSRTAVFEAANTVVNSTSLITPTGKDLRISAGDRIEARYEGGGVVRIVQYTPIPQLPSLASSATTDLGTVQSDSIIISGTTTITSFGSSAPLGAIKYLRFSGSLVITHNNSAIIMPGLMNFRTSIGDSLIFRHEGSGVWRCLNINSVQYRTSNKNYLDNPSFDIWQRYSSVTIASATTTNIADRWKARSGGTGRTFSRQTGFSGADFCLRSQRDSGNATTAGINFGIQLEDSIAKQLAGKIVIASFDVRTGADYSGGILSCVINTGTGSSEVFDWSSLTFATGNVSSGDIQTAGALSAGMSATRLNTSAYTVPSGATGLVFRFSWSPSGTASTNDYIEITNVKLEVGTSPSRFEPLTIGEVIDSCLRRYQKSFALATAPAQGVGTGTGEYRFPATIASTATNRLGTVFFQKTFLATPTITLYNPSTTNAQIRDLTAVLDTSNSSASNISTKSFQLTCSGSTGTAVGNDLAVHWSAEAER